MSTSALTEPALPAGPPLAAQPVLGRAPRRASWRLPLAGAAGLVLFLAFPPVAAEVLAPVGVAGLALATRGATARRGAAAGLVFGLAFFLPLLHWSGAVAGDAAWVALAVLQALFLALLGAGLAATSRLAAWPVWAAGLWVAQEAARGRLPFDGFAWGRLAASQDGSALTPLAALGGAPLVTFAIALLGGLLAALLLRPPPRRLAAGTALAAVVVVAGLVVPTPTDGRSVRVALVQGNVPRLGLDAFAQRAAVLQNHVDATRRLAGDVRAGRTPRPDLVVWPENASDIDPFTDPTARALIDGAVRDIGVPVLVGTLLRGPGDRVRNAGVAWDPVTGPGDVYVKQHLVPFGEYVPGRDLLRRVTDKVDLVPRDFAPGSRTGLVRVGDVPVADVICFEVADDAVVRDAVRAGGQLLVVQTNNASFGRSPQSEQQLAIGRQRAVEHGRAVLVASTSGISAVIAPDGQVVRRSEVFTRDVLVADVPLRTRQTPATRTGGAAELGLALLGVAALARALHRGRWRQDPGRPSRPGGSAAAAGGQAALRQAAGRQAAGQP